MSRGEFNKMKATRSSSHITLCLLVITSIALGCLGEDLFPTGGLKKDDPRCKSEVPDSGNVFYNLPILSGVYCYNNGTGICKALAGRFEFYFNVWTQVFLGPVESSQYVDSNGYHERVPTSYMPNGQVLYADRPINWSRDFTRNKPSEYNLLSATSFNWCKYATTNNWPYMSSILDHDKIHQIFFFNRQSCIYNPQTKEIQHFNTRFLHKSGLRIDLDYNPIIFAMEDNLLKEVRLVKNKRQHWYEMKWRLLRDPTPNLKYFVEMTPEDGRPMIVDGRGPLLRRGMYNKTADFCVSDYFSTRGSGNNAKLVPTMIGLDKSDIADYIPSEGRQGLVYDVHLHSIPRYPEAAQRFYGVDVRFDNQWEKFAKDGYSFSATTTIPLGKNKYEVISLFSYYQDPRTVDKLEEHYPQPYLARYQVTHQPGNSPDDSNWSGVENRKRNEQTKKLNLNYVDDIAYLHKCDSILVIFGPLYTEFPRNQFDLETKTTLGSIYDLGLNEMTEAFFAKDDKIYFYHRLNFIVEHKYTCGKGNGSLVTATRSGSYKFKTGPGSLPFIQSRTDQNHQEERFFKLVGMYKGSLSSPEAPDAAKYPWSAEEAEPPAASGLPRWIWFLVALGVVVLIIMFILGFVAFRRYRRRRYLAMTQRSEMPSLSRMSGQSRTNRSGMLGGRASGVSTNATVRSSRLKSNKLGGVVTGRTGVSSRPSSTGTSRSSKLSGGNSSTKRSKVASRSDSGRSNATQRSKVSVGSQSRPHSRTSSASAKSGASSRSRSSRKT